jgi:allophanate hydrolase subunit 2
MDPTSLASANRPLGNAPLTPGLEITLLGPELELTRTIEFCFIGVGATLDGRELAGGTPCIAHANQRLKLTRTTEARAYLAVLGGIGDLERPLRKGDPLGRATAVFTDLPLPRHDSPELRVIPGPQVHRFSPEAYRLFLRSEFQVGARCDRRGIRLEGVTVAPEEGEELESEAMARGAIQVPPDGQPIILGPDGPVTGGYPIIATLAAAELSRLGQLKPGSKVRFREISLNEAIDLRRR